MTIDARRILTAQGVRAFVYGFGSVLLGVTLDARGWSGARVGLLLTAVVAGTALTSVLVGRYGDRIGRRRMYGLLFLGLAGAGFVFAFVDQFWVLVAVALTGTLSTEVVESGPFTSLEQAMLPHIVEPGGRTRLFGVYNAAATIVGSLGALAAGAPALLRDTFTGAPTDQRYFLLFSAAGFLGAVIAHRLSHQADASVVRQDSAPPLRHSRGRVQRLAALFALDSFGGGFVIQSFIAYWFRARFGVSIDTLGIIFFVVGLLQSVSFLASVRIAERAGLLNTMVFTHLPSNLLLAAIPMAPNVLIATALLLGRFALSQMDVPVRQAYVMALVEPEERTAAAAYSNTARYIVRPAGPALAGAAQQVAFGLPFFIAGGLKALYDISLWLWFRRVPLGEDWSRSA